VRGIRLDNTVIIMANHPRQQTGKNKLKIQWDRSQCPIMRSLHTVLTSVVTTIIQHSTCGRDILLGHWVTSLNAVISLYVVSKSIRFVENL